MKDVRMIQLIVIIICVMGYSLVHAQADYLVLTKGDTLYGKVKHLSYGTQEAIQIEQKDSKRKVNYPMLQVKAFEIDNEPYHLIRTTTKYTYMKLISGGYLSLYAFRMDGQNIWNGRYLYKIDGSGMEVPTLAFKKKMAEYLTECPDLKASIESGDLNRNDLDSIIVRYNACISRNTNVKSQEVEVASKNAASVNVWEELESKIKNVNLEDKESVLEMIAEAKSKSSQGEKIPNFLKDALRKSLKDNRDLEELLSKALMQGDQ